MEKVEKFWNGVYYCFYKLDYYLHLQFNKINPVLLIYRIVFPKEKYSKMKGDLNEAFNNKKDGLSSLRASVGIYIISFMIVMALINFYYIVQKKDISPTKFGIITGGILMIITNHILLFHRNKYLKYFKEFDKRDHKSKLRLGFGTILFCIGVFY